MRKLFLILMLCVACASLAAQSKSIYDFTMKSIDGQPVSLSSLQRQGRPAGQCGQQMRLHAAVCGPRSALREVQRPRPGHRRHPRQQLCPAGTGHQRRDQEVLHQQVQRDLPHDGQGLACWATTRRRSTSSSPARTPTPSSPATSSGTSPSSSSTAAASLWRASSRMSHRIRRR